MNKRNYIVAIIGRPNVGKSTLFNRLIGEKLAITTDIAGTTRDRLYEIVEWQGFEFTLIDTAGLEFTFEERFKEDIQNQIDVALNEADLIVFMVDATTGITDMDHLAIGKLRKSGKNAILIANKADNLKIEQEISEFFKLGLGKPIPISAISGKGTGDLLDEIVNKLKTIKLPKIEKEEEESVKIAILGRPNVGKSTLLNNLTGEKRALVSETSGTTRDVIKTRLKFKNKNIDIIDTAGIRRRGKIGKVEPDKRKIGMGYIEKFSALRAFRSAEKSDVTLVLIDALEGITAQDQHIAGFAKNAGRGLILLINKTDVAKEVNPQTYMGIIKHNFIFIPFAPVIFISALTGKNTDKILEMALEIKERMETKIPTPKLNNFLEKIIMKHPPSGKGRALPKLKYITQVGTNPPHFIIFSSFSDKIHFTYKRFIENELRKTFDLTGTSIKIEIREK